MSTETFSELLEESVQELVTIVKAGLDDPIYLREWVADAGRVYDVRCSSKNYTNDEDMKDSGQVTYTRAGCPSRLHEIALYLLEAGFSPKQNLFLRNKIEQVVKLVFKAIDGKLHVPIINCTKMMCISDDFGVLNENEVSIRFGSPFVNEKTGRKTHFIEGDVLVARVTGNLSDLTI